MFKLFKLNDNKYLILKGLQEIEGTKARIISIMLTYGVAEEEIAYGLQALEQDDMAEYGINQTFIFSTKIKKLA